MVHQMVTFIFKTVHGPKMFLPELYGSVAWEISQMGQSLERDLHLFVGLLLPTFLRGLSATCVKPSLCSKPL